jgi:hypothetical protein
MLAQAVQNYGEDPSKVSGLLAQDPSTSGVAFDMLSSEAKAKADAERQQRQFDQQMQMFNTQQQAMMPERQLGMQKTQAEIGRIEREKAVIDNVAAMLGGQQAVGVNAGQIQNQNQPANPEQMRNAVAQLALVNPSAANALSRSMGDSVPVINPMTGEIEVVGSNKPMPVAAVKEQNDIIDQIGAMRTANKMIDDTTSMIDSGALNLGLGQNLMNSARNYIGAGNEESAHLAGFKSNLESMRNAILLLHKGVQTEGDAQRAMNQIISNINDEKTVKAQLERLKGLNAQAEQIKMSQLGGLRSNFGKGSIDIPDFSGQQVQQEQVVQYQEGDMVQNPETGDTLVYRSGKWVKE